jgi:Zn-dependent M28 family amino/carboxypeptidase
MISFTLNNDFLGYNNGGSGIVERPVQIVSGGCSIQDFSGFNPGHIALVNRGSFAPTGSNITTCSYRVKVDNAARAGASGILVYNPVDILPTLGSANDGVNVPVFGISSALASYLIEIVGTGQEAYVRLTSKTAVRTFQTINVIAETVAGKSDQVIVVGSHLDSVPAGPGINDNGSGSAANLEMAIQFSKLRAPVNKVRFIWFAAEGKKFLK